MKKNKWLRPAVVPAVKTRKIKTTSSVKKEYLKDLIDKYDCMPDNVIAQTGEDPQPDNYDGVDYEISDSCDQTSVEDEEY